MAIPAKPTIVAPPANLPVRGQNPTTFSNNINSVFGWFPSLDTNLSESIDWMDTVFTATETEATNAAASASSASSSATTATNQATLAEQYEDGAEAAAAAAQAAAGLPAISGKTGNVLTVTGGAGSEVVIFEPGTSHDHDASNIVSGTLSTARIPNLPASQITSGEFSELRIPAASQTIKGGVRVWKSGTTGYIYTSN